MRLCPVLVFDKKTARPENQGIFFKMTEPQTVINLDFYFGLPSLSLLDLDIIPPSIKTENWEFLSNLIKRSTKTENLLTHFCIKNKIAYSIKGLDEINQFFWSIIRSTDLKMKKPPFSLLLQIRRFFFKDRALGQLPGHKGRYKIESQCFDIFDK